MQLWPTYKDDIVWIPCHLPSLVFLKRNFTIIGNFDLVPGDFKQLDGQFLIDQIVLG